MGLRLATLIAIGLGLAATRRPAHALDVREKYEEALVKAALARHGLAIDPAPEGKRIERVVIDASQVILPGDFPLSRKIPWTWLNRLHVRTRPHVIGRELLFRDGDPYRASVIEESGRNLRGRLATILAVARIVAARGSAPDRVVILVVTKDQWSLRLNTELTIDQARLDYLSFSFSENNLAGRYKIAAVDFALDPGRYTVGAGYYDDRVWGSRHALRLAAALYLSRASSAVEGGAVIASIGRPLFSLSTRWAWEAGFQFLRDKVRFFRGGELNTIEVGDCTLAARGLPIPCEQVPDLYGRETWVGTAQVTRSFGRINKANLTLGYRVDRRSFYATEEIPADLSLEARAAYGAQLPRSEGASGPFLSLAAFRAQYVRLKDIDTFALSEDYRVGPSAGLSVRYANPNLGFGSHFVELSASHGALYYLRDNLFSYSFAGQVRLQEGVWPGSVAVNEEVSASVREVTPRFGPFRLHVAGRLRLRGHDLDRVRLVLGSSNGLRGYAPRAHQGNNVYLVNVELRTVALNLWSVHVGAVVFYDGGDAPDDLLGFGWHQDAGVGLRVLFPQFNHDVLRLDLAFPFERPLAGGYAPRFSVEFRQAF